MLRRFIIAIATVAAFGISFSSTNASAAEHGSRGGHSHTFNPKSFNGHSLRYSRHSHSGHSLRYNRRAHGFSPYGGYGYFPYGGFAGAYLPDYSMPDYSNYYIDPIGAFSMFQRLDPYIPLPPPLSCHRSQETKTVPSEDGGEREIRITRC